MKERQRQEIDRPTDPQRRERERKKSFCRCLEHVSLHVCSVPILRNGSQRKGGECRGQALFLRRDAQNIDARPPPARIGSPQEKEARAERGQIYEREPETERERERERERESERETDSEMT